MTTIGTTSRPAYVYDADTDTWVPIGVGPHTHDEYIDKTIIDAKGDIIVGTATDAVARLGVGEEGTYLTADPTSPTGLTWSQPSSVISSTTPPENTSAIWFNTENGNTYIYYDDFWTSIAGSSGAPIISDTPPVDPVLGTQWFNSSTGKSYLYYSDAWVEIDSNGTSTASTGNVIINGAFEINQRAFTSTTTSGAFGFDRWRLGTSGGTSTYSSEAFTPGAAPEAGYEASNFARLVTSGQSASGDNSLLRQFVEDVRTFANSTVTLSFWAKAGSGTPKVAVEFAQGFGSGGSTPVNTYAGQITLSTSWARYSVTTLVPSISGKTIGAGSLLGIALFVSAGSDLDARTGSLGIQNNTFDFWGVQLEAGAVATPFRRNAPSIQGELAACQRYYFRDTPASAGRNFGMAFINTTTAANVYVNFPVEMRIVPNVFEQTGSTADYRLFVKNNASLAITANPSLLSATKNQALINFASTGLVAGESGLGQALTTTGFLGFGAEL